MPLVAHTQLPTFQRLQQEGHRILNKDYALHQDIRELHIGILNMMPDAALEATERQFLRLVGGCNQIAQFHIHLFTIDGIHRGPDAQTHIDQFYESFESIKQQGLDGLIVSGANVTHAHLQNEVFWQPLSEVFEWAKVNVTSILCSCLATHALIQYCHKIVRTHHDIKRWGVFTHYVVDRSHPLVAHINTRFDVVHSRFNSVFRKDLEQAGLKVLVESPDVGVHLAVSKDGFRMVFFQGHPEYDAISLMKEYKRELVAWFTDQRDDLPPYPANYFSPQVITVLEDYVSRLEQARAQHAEMPEFPESAILPHLDNTWRDTAKAVFNNWLGQIYQITDLDRLIPFKEGIDPDDPLGLT
ncbi:MAG: homoserine O-succinyltransferase [Gammaproteobacteria bacterium]|nr:homoserine O-succinyltransferase [Gammaproteobacteria bacterium]